MNYKDKWKEVIPETHSFHNCIFLFRKGSNPLTCKHINHTKNNPQQIKILFISENKATNESLHVILLWIFTISKCIYANNLKANYTSFDSSCFSFSHLNMTLNGHCCSVRCVKVARSTKRSCLMVNSRTFVDFMIKMELFH